MASVPLGENLIPIQRGLTTSSTAIFIPFITQELFQTGAALYYGLNALSNNMILCDRKQLKNPNGLILGTPGSGKSFAAKREMANAFPITDDDIIICDPEAEYFSLVQRLKGQVIRLSPTGRGIDGNPQYVNPMDINLNYSEDDSPLALKSDFILSLCELVIGGKEGLQPVEKTVIDRAVRNVYRPFLADPDPEKMPVLGDLYDELLKQPEPEAARIAAALELYVSGSLNVFNHRTNVELENRLVCFDIKQLGKQLKKLGMLIVQDQVWNRVTVNRAEKKSTRYYMDEFHLLLKEEQTAAYRILIAPIKRSSIILGQLLEAVICTFLEVGIMSIVSLLFSVKPQINLITLLLTLILVFLTAFSMAGLAYGISLILPNEVMYETVMNAIVLPIFFLSNALFPVDGMKGFLAFIINANPFTHVISAIRSLLLYGTIDISNYFFVICLFMVIASMSFGWAFYRLKKEMSL